MVELNVGSVVLPRAWVALRPAEPSELRLFLPLCRSTSISPVHRDQRPTTSLQSLTSLIPTILRSCPSLRRFGECVCLLVVGLLAGRCPISLAASPRGAAPPLSSHHPAEMRWSSVADLQHARLLFLLGLVYSFSSRVSVCADGSYLGEWPSPRQLGLPHGPLLPRLETSSTDRLSLTSTCSLAVHSFIQTVEPLHPVLLHPTFKFKGSIPGGVLNTSTDYLKYRESVLHSCPDWLNSTQDICWSTARDPDGVYVLVHSAFYGLVELLGGRARCAPLIKVTSLYRPC